MSMLLPPLRLHEPTTVAEAVQAKAAHPESDWLAGGTDLLPNYKWGLNTRPDVISLHKVVELRAVSATRIGALATLTTLAGHADLRAKVPVVARTAGLVASPLLRNAGTLGGNLLLENRCFFFNQSHVWRASIDFCLKANGTKCHVVPQEATCYSTFSADLPAPLIALGAEYELAGPSGTRRVPAARFYKNDGIDRNVKRADELLTFVHLPADAPSWRASYEKLRQRDSWDFPELGIAVALRMDGPTVAALRIVANALEAAPLLLEKVAAPALGRPLTDALIDELAAAVEENVRPVKNTNLSPGYRKKMARVFARRALRAARDGPPPAPKGR